MGTFNLTLRGSIYWWRRRVIVQGHALALAISLRTGNFNQARISGGIPNAEVEKLRMAYGQSGVAIDPATLKKIFNDAMRSQLDRIVMDQTASGAGAEQHIWVNRAFAELWRTLAGPSTTWTESDAERLEADGWPFHARRLVPDLIAEHHDRIVVSKNQLDTYQERFGYEPTTDNLQRIRRVILQARAAACDEAAKQLLADPKGMDGWVDDALRMDTVPAPGKTSSRSAPAIVNVDVISSSSTDPRLPAATEGGQVAPVHSPDHGPTTQPKKLLRAATEECIEAHENAGAWSIDTVQQVNTAMRLFEHACGGDVAIEDLTQEHVDAFHKLCHAMPNRWEKTKDELDRGIPASLDYAQKLRARGDERRVGISPSTISKHITWIQAVLIYADDEASVVGHRPAKTLRFKTKRLMIGAKADAKKVRSRDLRANWTRKEIGRLLEAPIWYGCASLDERFLQGEEIFHDAWYWRGRNSLHGVEGLNDQLDRGWEAKTIWKRCLRQSRYIRRTIHDRLRPHLMSTPAKHIHHCGSRLPFCTLPSKWSSATSLHRFEAKGAILNR